MLAVLAVLVLTACGGAGTGTPPTVSVDDELLIVTPTPGTPAAPLGASGHAYVVQEGDTLSGIAARFGVTEAALQGANALDDPDRLVAGQRLTIPAAEP